MSYFLSAVSGPPRSVGKPEGAGFDRHANKKLAGNKTTKPLIGRELYSAIIQPHFQQLYEAEVAEGKSG